MSDLSEAFDRLTRRVLHLENKNAEKDNRINNSDIAFNKVTDKWHHLAGEILKGIEKGEDVIDTVKELKNNIYHVKVNGLQEIHSGLVSPPENGGAPASSEQSLAIPVQPEREVEKVDKDDKDKD